MEKTNLLQKKVIEALIDYINIGSAGRLIIFEPEKDTMAHLVIKKKGNYQSASCRLIVKEFLKVDAVSVSADVIKDTFLASDDLRILFLSFNQVSQKIDETTWIIPSQIFQQLAGSDDSNILRFQALLTGNDQYKKFLVPILNIGQYIFDTLDIKP